MANEPSPAELRKLQRERRAAKMARGSTRLNKILGSPDIKHESEIDDTKENGASSIGKDDIITAASTGKSDHQEQNVRSRSDKNSGDRISVILNQDVDDDPPVSGLDGLETIEPEISLESVDSPLQEFGSDENIEQEMEKLLNKILQNSAHDTSHPHAHGQGITDNTNAMFNGDMASMFPGLKPGMGPTGFGAMPAQPAKSKLDIAKAKVYQSGYAVIRFIIVWVLVSNHIERSSFTSGFVFPQGSRLWLHFLSTEAVLGAIYLLLSYLHIFPSHTIMSFDISGFGYPNSILTSYGLVKSFFTDFCFMIVVLGFYFYFGA
ncbi:hypothetical protein PICMEDRAFT_13036 [Pichia membranifaciens NRRL Y-2026]|uniref:Golgi to ER traffic protein 2 n=1 Tax=Pichia membranifaciens NRRL Y-2026 TaxID=763406 RepID=A0A1E3NGN1_9ASCO|nr:hypothetical protein PICMEDRAFT_13036 [Pichia membranifaciens NRRL Y-2026]ODQ45315.1 hypothetical protein PICMEDRAFT_13036 [Pichia membranifaciens NRRL Y-2026]